MRRLGARLAVVLLLMWAGVALVCPWLPLAPDRIDLAGCRGSRIVTAPGCAGARLTAAEAAARGLRIGDVAYRLHLELDADSQEEISGQVCAKA